MNTYKNSKFRFFGGPKNEILLLALLAIVVILIYADTLTAPFILDDIGNILNNPHIRIPSLSWENILRASFDSPESNRPVANLSFALNYYFTGFNLVGFHLVNLLIHILSGIFLYFLIKATLDTPMLQSGYKRCGWAAFFTAFIWLVHPLQTQSVVYVVQRMNSLAAMFYILSMLLYVRFRLNRGGQGNRWVICGCVFFGLLAIGSKQISATLPIFILLYEWFFFQKLKLKWNRRFIFFLFGLVTLVILISFYYLGQNPVDRIFSAYSYRDFTLGQRILTQFRVVVFYIGLLLWPKPSRLNLDHDFTLSYSLMNPVTTLISVIIIITLGGLAILIAKKDPLVSFGIVWFFGNLVIESSVIGLELVFEHRNYLPSMFLTLAMVSLVLRYVKSAWLASLSLCLVAALFIVWTFERNKVWSDELALYRDCAEKSPAKARPHNNLGSILLRRNRLPEAIDAFRRALNLKQDYADAHYNLGNALVKQGNFTEGIYHYSETLRLRPRNVKALNNMAATLVLKKRYDEAILYLKKALDINPKDPDLHNNIATLFKKQGDLAKARHHFIKTLEISPNRESAHLSLSEIERQLQKARDIEEIKDSR